MWDVSLASTTYVANMLSMFTGVTASIGLLAVVPSVVALYFTLLLD